VAVCGNSAPILELGVGTGRIALPTAAAGGRVVGVDIAYEMLRVAGEKWVGYRATEATEGSWEGRVADAGVHPSMAESKPSLSLVQADVAQLPFANGSFAAALAVHVLHLLPDWRAGLAEIVRVLQPGGMIVQGNDWREPASCVGQLRGELRRLAMELLPGARPPGAGAAIPQALNKLGGTTSEPEIVASWVRPVSPAQVLAGMAARVDAETWAMPDDILAMAIERLTAWASTQWMDLEEVQQVEHRFVLTVTRF
jgi:SAM-dependent methyltransferase